MTARHNQPGTQPTRRDGVLGPASLRKQRRFPEVDLEIVAFILSINGFSQPLVSQADESVTGISIVQIIKRIYSCQIFKTGMTESVGNACCPGRPNRLFD